MRNRGEGFCSDEAAIEWPLPRTRWTRLYLHSDRSLAAVPAAGSGALDYAFEPRDPAPTVGGAISSGEPVMYAGAFRSERRRSSLRRPGVRDAAARP